MDTAAISALSAVMGSLVGGAASIATAWLTQRTQGRRERVSAEILKREMLYAEFVSECTKLLLESLDHSLDNPERMTLILSVQNRIRLRSSEAVVAEAAGALKRVLDRYFSPNMTPEQLRDYALSGGEDPLKAFSEACRKELATLTW